MDLLTAWADWNAIDHPYIFPSDRFLLESKRSVDATIVWRSWKEAYQHPEFAKPGDTRLHLGLLPQPFIGDLKRASVFILLLNPGLGPGDYFGEYMVKEFRSALVANLKQDFSGNVSPFLFLDPQFAWHGGFNWWQGKLAGVITQLSSSWNTSFAVARERLASELASIELFPYRSGSFRDADSWLTQLASVKLARSFVTDFVLPKVRENEAVLVITRKVKNWGIVPEKGVVQYSHTEARAAHLTPNSRGGSAILEFIIPKWS